MTDVSALFTDSATTTQASESLRRDKGEWVAQGADEGSVDFLIECLEDLTNCPECGTELQVTLNLKRLFCPNEQCGVKPVFRLLGVAKELNIPYLGEKTCEKVVRHLGPDHMRVFTLDPDSDLLFPSVGANVQKSVMSRLVEIRSEPRTLADLVRMSFLPGLRDQATKLFKGYGTFEDFYNDLYSAGDEGAQVSFVQSRLGYSPDRVSQQAIKVYTTVTQFERMLRDIEPYFNILPVDADLETKILVMSGSMGNYGSKASFFSQAAEAARGRFNLEQSGSLTKGTDFLVTYETETQKVQKAQKDGYNVQILTPEDFMELLSN